METSVTFGREGLQNLGFSPLVSRRDFYRATLVVTRSLGFWCFIRRTDPLSGLKSSGRQSRKFLSVELNGVRHTWMNRTNDASIVAKLLLSAYTNVTEVRCSVFSVQLHVFLTKDLQLNNFNTGFNNHYWVIIVIRKIYSKTDSMASIIIYLKTSLTWKYSTCVELIKLHNLYIKKAEYYV